MKSQNLLRAAVCLMSLLWVGPAFAQMRDVENATPRVPVSFEAQGAGQGAETYSPAQCAQLLHELTTTLQLQPYQVLVMRRTLAAHLLPASSPWATEAADDAAAVAAPGQELRMLLSETQLARLRQWETARPGDRLVNLVASLQ